MSTRNLQNVAEFMEAVGTEYQLQPMVRKFWEQIEF